MNQFETELKTLINKHSKENDSDTPDFILAEYIDGCLTLFNKAVKNRDFWWKCQSGEKEKKTL